MKKHTKVYFEYFGYDESSWIPCEICQRKAVDVHHINSRGMGGSKTKDLIENLVALCRDHHVLAETDKEYNKFVELIHLKNLKE